MHPVLSLSRFLFVSGFDVNPFRVSAGGVLRLGAALLVVVSLLGLPGLAGLALLALVFLPEGLGLELVPFAVHSLKPERGNVSIDAT